MDKILGEIIQYSTLQCGRWVSAPTPSSSKQHLEDIWQQIHKYQSVTYRYREFFIFWGVSEPVSEKFGTGKTLGTETLIFVAKI